MEKQKEKRVKRPRTYFTKAELVSFGNYILGDQRATDLRESFSKLNIPVYNESEVQYVDIANWQELNKKS